MTNTTTRNLAREVAEALGWRFKVIGLVGCTQIYRVICPDESVAVWASNGRWKTETIPQYCVHKLHPDYPNDLNACARDLTREGWIVTLRKSLGNEWRCNFYLPDMTKVVSGEDTNPAVAWCESFLALQRYVEGQLAKGEQS